MKLIKPSLISGEIMTLIEESDERLILVSPYCNFNNWNKLKKSFEIVDKEKVNIEFYVREGESKSIKEVEELGFKSSTIKNLHTKLYLNEKYGIVSSMNLVVFSDSNSLDIAYKTETKEEYEELIKYYKRYIVGNKKQKPSIYNFSSQHDFFDYVINTLENKLNSNFEIYIDENAIVVQGRNRYRFHVSYEYGRNSINANGILTGYEFDNLEGKEKRKVEKTMKLPCHITRNKGEYDQIWHHSKLKLKTESLDNIENEDYNVITPIIIDFIVAIEKYKDVMKKKNSW